MSQEQPSTSQAAQPDSPIRVGSVSSADLVAIVGANAPEAPAASAGLTWRDVKRRADKVALVGFASTSRHDAPFGDPSFEIWVLNDLCRQVPKWDRMFEVHPREYVLRGSWKRPDGTVEGNDYWQYLCEQPAPDSAQFCPVYTVERYGDMPASVPYPFDEVRDLVSAPWGEDYYMTSTPAQMLGLAMLEGFKEIHLYGIDLISNEEYGFQRPALEYYIGFARGMGVNVVVPRQSALCKASYCYGKSFPSEPGMYGPLKTIMKSQREKLEADGRRLAEGVAATGAGLQFLAGVNGIFARELKKQEGKPAPGMAWPRRHGEALRTAPAFKRMLKLMKRVWFRQAERERQRMTAQHQKALEGFHTASGTVAGLASVEVWADHLERGGVVKS